MPHDAGSGGSWHPGDPHGVRILCHAFFWAAGVIAIWATLRVLMLGDRFLIHYLVALVLFVLALFIKSVFGRERRRREPF